MYSNIIYHHMKWKYVYQIIATIHASKAGSKSFTEHVEFSQCRKHSTITLLSLIYIALFLSCFSLSIETYQTKAAVTCSARIGQKENGRYITNSHVTKPYQQFIRICVSTNCRRKSNTYNLFEINIIRLRATFKKRLI